MTLDNSVRRRFAWPVRAIHWISAGLVLVAYLTTELAEEAEHGEAVGINWHVAAGLALLLLFVPRLLAKLLPRPGPLMPPAPNWTRLPHALVTLALLLFVLVQPVLGVLSVWAEGDALAIPFTPNHAEYVYLQGRRVLADQMDFLRAHFPRSSPLHQRLARLS